MIMNVFVLCTGRCGSQTFAAECRHITNFTSGHETRASICGPARLDYPQNHIEADNRLSWFLGDLDNRFGTDAFYVHLTRDPAKVAASYAQRMGQGIAKAYREGILMGAPEAGPIAVTADLVHTVTANIQFFLKDKPRKASVRLETAKEYFEAVWRAIAAEGDLAAALAEFDVVHDVKKPPSPRAGGTPNRLYR